MKSANEQQKEEDQYREDRDLDENEVMTSLNYITGDHVQFSYRELYEITKDAHPDTPLSEETRDFYVQEMMRISPIKPHPKYVERWLDNYLAFMSSPSLGKYAKQTITIIKRK